MASSSLVGITSTAIGEVSVEICRAWLADCEFRCSSISTYGSWDYVVSRLDR